MWPILGCLKSVSQWMKSQVSQTPRPHVLSLEHRVLLSHSHVLPTHEWATVKFQEIRVD